MRGDYLVDARVPSKVDAYKKLGIDKGEMRQVPRAIFDFLKLFGVHQNDELGVCIDRANVRAHTRTFGAITTIAFFSIGMKFLE